MKTMTTNKFRSKAVTHFVSIIVVIIYLHQKQVDGLSSASTSQQQQQVYKQYQQQLHQQPENALNAHNFLVGIARIGAQYEAQTQTQCGHELEQLLEAIDRKQLWGLKVLDSFGSAPRSFLWGNYFWFGAQDLCDELNEPFSISFSKQYKGSHEFNVTSPFPMEFMLIYAEFQTPHYIDLKLPFKYFLHLGLCLPSSCSAVAIFNYTNLYFRDGNNFETQRNYQLQLQPVEMRHPRFSWAYFKQPGCLFFFFIFFLVISLAIIAEIVYKSKKRLQAQQRMHLKTNAQLSEISEYCDVANKISTNVSIYENILMCFRLSENYHRAIALDKKTQSSENFLSAIAGLRTIICLWVTVFHVYYYSLYAMTNAPLIFAKLEYFALQPIMQACFYVDVFFVMSAFLLVYNFMQNEKQIKQIRTNCLKENLKLYGKSVLHRYLRLTPVMIITMLLSDMVFDFLNMYSPFRLGEHSGIYCKRWWYNLFYIHNLLDMQDICCSWTWYLACEMQYFLLFTALLYIFAKYPKVTQMIFGILTFMLVVISWLCNYLNGITFQIDVIHTTLNELYVKPWVRINPYIGGAIAGWLLHHLQQKRQQHVTKNANVNININNKSTNTIITNANSNSSSNNNSNINTNNININTNNITINTGSGDATFQRFWLPLFWFSCFALYVVTNFMSYWRSMPAWLVSVIMSFGKLIFALYIGGVIVLCALGHGGVFQRLLSIRLLQFLNRFCFSIYMLAPVVVIAVFGLRREATNFNEVGSGLDFLASLTLSIASAFLMVLLVELPMQRISNIFVKGSSVKIVGTGK